MSGSAVLQNRNSCRSTITLPRGVLLTPDFPPQLGGIATYLFHVYERFDLGRVTLIAPSHPQAAEFDARMSYLPRRIESIRRISGLWGASYLYRTYRAASRELRRDRATVLHCGHAQAAVVARRLKHRFGVSYLVWTHALEIMDNLVQPIVSPALRDADLVLTNSDFTARYLRSISVDPGRIVQIRPGTDPERFRPGLDCEDLKRRLGLNGKKVLLTVGRIARPQRYKGQDQVIRALPTILSKVPNMVYVIAGAGNDVPYLLELAERCGVARNVIIGGRVEEDDLPALYDCCDAFIMCSREERTMRGILVEGFGIVFLEAAACGKPTIGGISGGIPNAVVDGVTGMLVDGRDCEAISRAVIRLMTDRELASQMGARGRRWVIEEMNWDRAARDFTLAYQRVFDTQLTDSKTVASPMPL